MLRGCRHPAASSGGAHHPRPFSSRIQRRNIDGHRNDATPTRRKATMPRMALATDLGGAQSPPKPHAKLCDERRAAHLEKIQMAAKEASDPVPVSVMARNLGRLWFTRPEVPTAGAPLAMYVNATMSQMLCGCNKLELLMGFNNWSLPEEQVKLVMERHKALSASGGDWWTATVPRVPENATSAELVFCANGNSWENNSQADFHHTVLHGPATDDGTIHIHELPGPDPSKNIGVRVWLPPGYSSADAPEGGYPVVYLNDGQNLFDEKTAFGGVSWEAGIAATHLISIGKLPPFVIVGIDNRGVDRGWDYTPYPCGAGKQGFRKDAANWPGGGVWFYLDWVVGTLMPWVEGKFACSRDPNMRVFGGSSLGGICALCCAMKFHDVFQNILCESPSFWIKEGQFLHDLADYTGQWPQKLFLAMGTQEYSGTRKGKEPQYDEWMINYAEKGRSILVGKGLDEGTRLKYKLESGAAHNERDWARRLPEALEFLLEHTRNR